MRHSFAYQFLFFAALAVSLLSLAPGLAHLLELPRKVGLPRDAYFTVQQIYRGWSLFGIVLLAQVALLAALAIASRRDPGLLWPVLGALAAVALAQALFWSLTWPANAATADWTEIPGNWRQLRRNWEYSHAAGALCQLSGFLALMGGALRRL